MGREGFVRPTEEAGRIVGRMELPWGFLSAGNPAAEDKALWLNPSVRLIGRKEEVGSSGRHCCSCSDAGCRASSAHRYIFPDHLRVDGLLLQTL